MRDALSSLTTRGRTFLAGGVTAVACGLLLGQWTMARLGLLVILLPLVAALLLTRSQDRLTLKREVLPRRVSAGQSATVNLTLANEGSAPTGTLLLEEVVPYALGQRPRFVLQGAGRGWVRQLTYPVRSEVRGRHEIGPMTVRVTDPFGMVELGRTFNSTFDLITTPRTVTLSSGNPAQSWTGSGHSRPRSFSVGHAEDVTVREYHLGDDVRRVHWPSSARTDELMVRREEQPWQARTVIVLDTRSSAHRGHGPASSFEDAVRTAASVALHLVDQGHEVLVASATRLLPLETVTEHSLSDATAILEALAVVRVDAVEDFDLSWLTGVAAGTQVVAVLGHLAPGDLSVLARLERHGHDPRAIVLDVDAWTVRPQERSRADHAVESALRAMGGAGWRVSALGPADELDAVWQRVTR